MLENNNKRHSLKTLLCSKTRLLLTCGINEIFMAPKMQKYVQNASLNLFNRFYWNLMRWQTCLNVLVNLFFEIYVGTKLTCLMFLVSSLCISWCFQYESIFVLVFIPNLTVLEIVASTRIATCAEQELSFRIIATSPRCLFQKV